MHSYFDRRPGSQVSASQSRTIHTTYLADCAALGLAPIEGVTALADRAEAIGSYNRSAPAAAQAAADQYAEDLADGAITPDDAAAGLAGHQAHVAADAQVGAVLRHAVARCHQKAVELIRPVGESVVVDQLRPLVAAALTKAAKVAPQLEGIADADQAAAAGPKIAGAWAELVDAHRTWLNACALADHLRTSGVLPATATMGRRDYFVRSEHQWARPDLVAETAHRDPRCLIDLAEAGPGIYTAAEAQEHVAAITAAEQGQTPASRPYWSHMPPERVTGVLDDLAAIHGREHVMGAIDVALTRG